MAADSPRSRDSNETNSLIHLYRGELGRMTLYRVRLDTTTNWAVVTTAGIVTFALGNAAVPHAVFLFAMLLTLFFLNLEARRFRFYETSHRRVRLLERGFYTEVLGGQPEVGWEAVLLQNLQRPESPVSQLGALGWRLRRTYLWVYLALLVAWWGKLTVMQPDTDTPRDTSLGLESALAAATVGALPGAAVVLLVSLFYLLLLLTAVVGSRRYPLEPD
jgi:uncharacterized membrane protein